MGQDKLLQVLVQKATEDNQPVPNSGNTWDAHVADIASKAEGIRPYSPLKDVMDSPVGQYAMVLSGTLKMPGNVARTRASLLAKMAEGTPFETRIKQLAEKYPRAMGHIESMQLDEHDPGIRLVPEAAAAIEKRAASSGDEIKSIFDDMLDGAYKNFNFMRRGERRNWSDGINKVYNEMVNRGLAGQYETPVFNNRAAVKAASDAGANLKKLAQPPVVVPTQVGDLTRADKMIQALAKFGIAVTPKQQEAIQHLAKTNPAETAFLSRLKFNFRKGASKELGILPFTDDNVLAEYRRLHPIKPTFNRSGKGNPISPEEEAARNSARDKLRRESRTAQRRAKRNRV
jgi:hypothetical protein